MDENLDVFINKCIFAPIFAIKWLLFYHHLNLEF